MAPTRPAEAKDLRRCTRRGRRGAPSLPRSAHTVCENAADLSTPAQNPAPLSPARLWSLDIWLRVSPGGRRENSPAVHCRVCARAAQVPKGRLSSNYSDAICSGGSMSSSNLQGEQEQAPKVYLTHPSLRDSCSAHLIPAVNCRAIVRSPSGRFERATERLNDTLRPSLGFNPKRSKLKEEDRSQLRSSSVCR